jgi:23S rRNA (pseudouridine1915-N3)-methyltransferase
MKINIIYIGSKKSLYDEAIDEYKKRLTRYADISESRIEHSDIKKESEALESKIEKSDVVVLLDETGTSMSSIDFAEYISDKQNSSTKKMVIIIGGAYGVSDNIKERADMTLSLSKMVFPHELARLIMYEQVYRAYSILAGSLYHHE